MTGTAPTQTYHKLDKPIDTEILRTKLKVKHFEAKKRFEESHAHAHKYLKEKSIDVGKLREHSAKIIGAGALTGTLLLSGVKDTEALPSPHEILDKLKGDNGVSAVGIPQKLLVDNMQSLLPNRVRPLSRNEEKILEQLFEGIIGVKARSNLEGEHLNTTYGLIGYEQHLKRFPGDTVANHDVQKAGIAPGRGAWGYFADSKENLTKNLIETEKWYAVVQTMYLPDWNTRQPYLRDWYQYRKVLIVNSVNGNAVVAAIADAGPAAWTGKHFGGSPEVMEYLGGARYKKGAVVIFFVDDPENKVPLGPVEYNKVNLPVAMLKEI